MKKKKKYQNQLISLNQNIHIKYYLNFLTFFFINGFRLKYYYNYISYFKLFSIFSKILGFSIRSSFLLKTIMLPNFFYFKLFKNYGSFNLNKFVHNKNIYLDSNFQFFFNSANKYQLYKFKNFDLVNKKFSLIKDSSNNSFIIYNNFISNYNYFNYNYYIYLEFLNILFFLILSNKLNLYKFNLLLFLNINFK